MWNYPELTLAILLGAVLLIGFSILVFKKPLLGFGILLVYVPIMPTAPKTIGLLEVIFLIIGGLTFIALLIRILSNCQGLHILNIDLPILVLLLWMASSLFLALGNEATVYDWFRQLAPFLGLAFYFFLKEEIQSLEDIKYITYFFIICAMLHLVKIIFALVVIAREMPNSSMITARGAFDPVAFSNLLFAFVGYLGGYLAISPKWKLWYIVGLLITASLHVFLLSRSVIVNYCFVMGAFIWINFKNEPQISRKITKFVAMLVIILISAVMIAVIEKNLRPSAGLIESYKARFESPAGYENRWREIQAAWQAGVGSYFLGEGLGSKLKIQKVGKYFVKPFIHNLIAYIFFTLGLPGILILVWLFYSGWRMTSLTKKLITDPTELAIYYGYIVGLLAMLIQEQVEAGYRWFIFSLYISLTLAVLARLYLMHQYKASIVHKKLAFSKIGCRMGGS